MTERIYQAELDGLRALAVVGVLLCHLDFDWLPGGFVGVDIFFVLSGYLITRLIVTEIGETGRFRFGNFYVRRIRRLYPALVTTVIAAWIGSFLLLSPEQMLNFVQSAIAALFSYSNVLFSMQADYFDALATTKPLLHTWSLSVEEQFYLVWPLLLLIASRARGKVGMLVALALVCVFSLALAQYWLPDNPALSFYMLPARAVELGLGAVVVFLPALRDKWLLNAATIAGVAAMIAAMMLYSDETPFPGVAALLPCVGAALFIIGAQSWAAGAFRLPPVAWIGRISYSLYLVHWPLIVLWRAYTYRPIETTDAWLLAAFAIMLAWLQYTLIEQRFRRPVPDRNRTVIGALAAIAVLVTAASAYGASTHGLKWRIPSERLTQQAAASDTKSTCGHYNPDMDKNLIPCQIFRHAPKDLYAWGDSHAGHLAAGLTKAYPDYNIYIMVKGSCQPAAGFGRYLEEREVSPSCVERNVKAFNYFLNLPPTNIIITNFKRMTVEPHFLAEATQPIVEALRAKGHKVVFLGDFIPPRINLVECVAAPTYVVSDQRIKERCVVDPRTAEPELAYNDQLSKLLPDYVSPNDVQCPDRHCQYFRGARLLFRDNHHLNDRGSKLFVPKLKPLLPF